MSVNYMTGKLLKNSAYYFLLGVIAIPFVIPLLWMLSTAFKPAAQIYATPPQWFPNPLTTDNFSDAWKLLDFPVFVRNSLLITSIAVLGTVLSSSLVGFAFAVLPGRGKRALFATLLATIMVPSSMTLIPVFIGFARLGLTNTFLPLVLPSFFANAFYVFLFRQYFRTLPVELLESAELDGCNPISTFARIALPLSRPALIAVGVFSFIATWNDFLTPLVYLSTNDKFTLSLGLSLFQGIFFTQIQYLMPMSLVALVPITFFFLVTQKFLLEGIYTGGFKPL